jgi:hypothetical protein
MFDLDAPPRDLLTLGNPKTAKGTKHGVHTAIMHLAPAFVSGRNTCPHATDGCRAACLNTAGRGGIGLDSQGLNTIQAARIRRTRYFHADRTGFLELLVAEIEKHVKACERHGVIPAVRLNGTSDLPWERFSVVRNGRTFPHVFAAFPRVTFYDYTKWPIRLRKVAGIRNYSLTYSLAESNDSTAADALRSGVNVAAVFDTRKSGDLPAAFTIDGETRVVIDGDATDLRFRDPKGGVIVGLRAKGRAKSDRTGFVRREADAPKVGGSALSLPLAG